MKITLSHIQEGKWKVIGENGFMNCHLEKDGYGIWFVPDADTDFSINELEAIVDAMKELK